MTNKLALITLFFAIAFAPNIVGQQQDFGSSFNIGVTYKFNPRLSVDLNQMSYFRNNSQNLWFTFTDASVNLRHNKHFSSEMHLRGISHVLTNESFQSRQMIYFVENFQGKIKKLKLNFEIKSRWQYSAIENHWNDSFKGPYFYHRFRVNLEKPINYHYKLSFNTEFFEPINRPTHPLIDQIRYTTSLGYRQNKFWSFSLSHQVMQQLGIKNPYLYNFVGLAAHYTF